jgi:hypothetical protein
METAGASAWVSPENLREHLVLCLAPSRGEVAVGLQRSIDLPHLLVADRLGCPQLGQEVEAVPHADGEFARQVVHA